MKKIKYIMMIAGFAAMGCGQPKIDLNKIEITNTAEDMIEYMYADMADGSIDTAIGMTYIINLQEIVDRNTD